MTDYEHIKSMCLSQGELWEDPDFPATQSSVFYFQTPPFNFVWKRAKELYAKPSFVLDNCDTFDVVPGKMGDKWLVSCLGVLYLSKGLFYRVVPADQRFDDPYSGVFRFRLWWCGQWLEVLVDDRLPTVNGRLAFLQSSHTEQLWPALLEKAYAKLHGSYEALKYGSLLDGLADLTGGITESLSLADVGDAPSLYSVLRTTSVVTCAHHSAPTITQEKIIGLELDMNYRIYAVDKVDTTEGPTYIVRICRPLAAGDAPITHVVLDSAKWKSISLHERERLTTVQQGFWMLYSDFRKVFTHVELVHLDAETSRDEPSLADKHRWHMRMHQGGWRRGVSAGGCRNNTEFFHTNPQVQISLEESDSVVISLHQHSIMDPKVIGFSVYALKKPHFTEMAPAAFFKKNKSTINSQYTNSRQVSHRCKLEAGAYLVLPTTFESREEANFSLRVFSSKSLKLKVLDSPPKMIRPAVVRAPSGFEAKSFSQYEAVFLQLADEHRTIDAFELQELLDACLPNDYIKSCASIDTCRQIVLTMDTRGTGRVSLSDFKDLMCSLKCWQVVFRTHAREKMGVLLAERLRDALKDVGFVLPEKALALLVLRYMRKDGMLRFGDFVSAVLHLQRGFNVFEAKEAAHSGSVHLNLSEVIQQLKESRVTTQRKSMDYYWISKYDFMEIGGEEILFFKKKTVDDPTVRIVPVEKYYEILTEIHKGVGHGGRLKMIQNIKNKLYIPKKAIEIFVDQCSVCEMKRSVPKKGIVTQPIISKDFNARGQVDLVDLQSAPDGEYKWLMNYQDHATKFLHLRPLKTKRASEVAMELLKIFLEFGAPCILQSDNGREFTAHVIEELVKMWPDCKIIHGSPRHPQTQGSVERSNQDVENMLRCWMKDNKCTKWSVGCYFVQYYKNCSHHRIIGRSPYRAMFGSDPKTILKGCNIPDTLLSSIQTEEELSKITHIEASTTTNYKANIVVVSDILLTSGASNYVLNQNVAENEESSVPEETKPEAIINKTGANIIFDAFAKDITINDEGTLIMLEVQNNNELVSSDDQSCIVCGQGTSGVHSCSSCYKRA